MQGVRAHERARRMHAPRRGAAAPLPRSAGTPIFARMPPSSPYRTLPVERRVALVHHLVRADRAAHATFVSRIVAKGGGFRAVAVAKWPTDRLAKEVVRMQAETPQDELDLLQTLYVDLEPQIQIDFLTETGVPHENGRIAEETEPPFASAEAVQRGVTLVASQHGADGLRYLRTLVRYARDAWPGIEAQVAKVEQP